MAHEAAARLAPESGPAPGGGAHTRISLLRSDWPLMLRTTSPPAAGPVTEWACRDVPAVGVHLVAGAAGPLGGDRLRLEVDVGADSALMLGEVAATLLLPGSRGEQSRLDVRLRVGAGATLVWQPEVTITAHGCRHVTDVRIALEHGARLLLREAIAFGRHGEPPGSHRQRLRITTPDGPLHDQELHIGPAAPGWDGPAVTGGHHAIGTLLLVDPGTRSTATDELRLPDTAFLPLSDHATLFSSLAADTATLRRRLDQALDLLLADRSAQPDGAAPAPAGM